MKCPRCGAEDPVYGTADAFRCECKMIIYVANGKYSAIYSISLGTYVVYWYNTGECHIWQNTIDPIVIPRHLPFTITSEDIAKLMVLL
jgi:hypothetical protein